MWSSIARRSVSRWGEGARSEPGKETYVIVVWFSKWFTLFFFGVNEGEILLEMFMGESA